MICTYQGSSRRQGWFTVSVYKRCPISLAADGWSQCLCVLHSPCLTVQSRQSLCIRLVPMFVCVFYSLCSYNAVPSVPLYSASASVCVCVLHSLCFYNAVPSVPLHTETAVASVCVYYTVFVFKTQSRQFHCTRLVSECVFYTVFVLFYNAVPSVPLHTTGILHSLCFYNLSLIHI